MENSTQSISRLAQSLGILVCSLMTMAADAQELSFNRDVRPILSDACFFCHGPDPAHREAGLRLDVEEDAKELAIVPGKVEQSELVARITSDDEELLMPPPASGKRLTQQQQEILKRWIAAGAKYEPYWAYVPPQPHRP
ncbi:MAG: hypothetical protein MI861_13290, partial [Pirellulales bacterium]|nr:hypothetical protein [Pirellulales bacterium]